MNRLKKGIGVVGSTTIDQIITGDHSYLKLGGVTTYATKIAAGQVEGKYITTDNLSLELKQKIEK